MQRAFLVSAFVILLAACSGGGSEPPSASTTVTVSGAIQKGPFIIGSTVTINALTTAGVNTPSTIVTQTTDNYGRFSFSENAGTLVEISSTGFYRNEITGGVSGASITLRSLYSVASARQQNAHVNVLTHVTSGRVLRLMASGSTIGAAIDQAETEFLQQFSSVVPSSGERDFNSLSIYTDRSFTGSAYLLAVSSIVHRYSMDRAHVNGTSPDAELAVFVNELAADFADGAIDRSLSAVRAAIPAIDPAAVTSNVMAWMGAEPDTSVPNINAYLDSDLDGIFNQADEDDDGDGIADVRDPAPYRATRPAALSGTPRDAVTVGSSYAFRPTLQNPDRLTVVFSGTGIPPWAALDPSTGSLTGSPDNVHGGRHSGIRIVATSAAGSASIGPFSIDVVTNPWRSLAPVPLNVEPHAVTSHDGNLFVFGSVIAKFDPFVARYEIATNTWHTLTSMNVLRIGGASAHTVNGSIHLIGGYYVSPDRYGPVPVVEAYSPSTDAWSPATPMNESRSNHTSCVHDGKVYVFGGSSASVEMFDPSLGTWIARSPMLEPDSGHECAALNDRIYVLAKGGDFNNRYDVYNPNTDTWEAGGAMWTDPAGSFSVAVLGDEIYVFGGRTWSGYYRDEVYAFDPRTSIWTRKTSMPKAGPAYSAEVVDGKVYVIGAKGSFMVYDPAFDPR